MDGARYFALWPLSQAAVSCFGTEKWPEGTPVHSMDEFDVENVETATAVLKKQGYRLLVTARKEPWGKLLPDFFHRRAAGWYCIYPMDARKKTN